MYVDVGWFNKLEIKIKYYTYFLNGVLSEYLGNSASFTKIGFLDYEALRVEVTVKIFQILLYLFHLLLFCICFVSNQ